MAIVKNVFMVSNTAKCFSYVKWQQGIQRKCLQKIKVI